MKTISSLAAGMAGAGLLAAPALAETPAEFYKGKTVAIMVPGSVSNLVIIVPGRISGVTTAEPAAVSDGEPHSVADSADEVLAPAKRR